MCEVPFRCSRFIEPPVEEFPADPSFRSNQYTASLLAINFKRYNTSIFLRIDLEGKCVQKMVLYSGLKSTFIHAKNDFYSRLKKYFNSCTFNGKKVHQDKQIVSKHVTGMEDNFFSIS